MGQPDSKAGSPHLVRRFGLLQSTALNMSNMIGIGPFITVPVLMSTMGGGPQAMIGWLLAVLIVGPPPALAQEAASAPRLPAGAASTCPALLQKNFKKLQDESDQSLCQYAGKVVLIVNTASYCGYTSQYEGLEALYAKYASRGLVVLGFPSNDFEQEPGSNKDIADFCYNTYGVKFPMFAKTSVVGKQANPLYLDLARATNKRPEWNFHKYLIDRQGKPMDSFASVVSPTDRRFVSEIERLLAS
jgi:glutathione peroxidase